MMRKRHMARKTSNTYSILPSEIKKLPRYKRLISEGYNEGVALADTRNCLAHYPSLAYK